MVLFPLQEPLQTLHGPSAETKVLQLSLNIKPQSQYWHVLVQQYISGWPVWKDYVQENCLSDT